MPIHDVQENSMTRKEVGDATMLMEQVKEVMTVYQEMEDESSWLTLEQMGFPLRSEFANENQGEAGNNAMTSVLIKPQFFCKEASAPLHMRTCTSAYAFFCGECACI
jgi:hypothetical protein